MNTISVSFNSHFYIFVIILKSFIQWFRIIPGLYNTGSRRNIFAQFIPGNLLFAIYLHEFVIKSKIDILPIYHLQ